MKKDIVVVYLFSKYDSKKSIFNFIKNYKKFKSGKKHKLIICFKGSFNNSLEKKIKKLIHPNKFRTYVDPNVNDYDWGSYRRIASFNKKNIMFFFNCHSYPVVDNWLKKFYDNFGYKVVLAPTGSFQSLTSSCLNGMYFNNFIKSFYYGILNLRYFKLFPNPHIRSNCYMISAKDYINLDLNVCNYKVDTWKNESGRNGMTQQLLKKGYKIYVINKKGEKIKMHEWKKSETYAYKNQSQLIIEDKHTREYNKLDKRKKFFYSVNCWGDQ